jgi:hypothetical protein
MMLKELMEDVEKARKLHEKREISMNRLAI